ncbi:MAG: sugar isomerase [Ruminococcaceae bacterium]|nr:sugar isomerase [Oscillospiraceae bacterium]
MNRKKKLFLNVGTAIGYQLITIVCGFVLPQFIIPYFGSATNGLINSITQFLTIITLCECGVGAVVQSALYKPLADRNDEDISKVVISSNRFFNKIVRILGIYVIGLMVFYPIIVKNEFSPLYTASLVLILAFSYLVQYYLFLTYRLLLNADQLSYIQLGAHSIALIFNAGLTILLIKLGASVHLVKLGSVVAFFFQPLLVKIYIDKRYHLNLKLPLTEEPLKQKWNGLAQHIASVVQSNVATVVLTVFSTLESISIYSVYYLVAHGIRQIIITLNTGVTAMLGNMYAKNESETLNQSFSMVEFSFHTLVTLLFGITAILIIPFVRIYTVNFTDAEYIQPVFAALMVLGQATYCLRIPYEMMISVTGQYKQTQMSSIIEAAINIVTACILVLIWGMEGVAVSTILAMSYRMIYLVIYNKKNILKRPIRHFVKHLAVDGVSLALMVAATAWINVYPTNYIEWAGVAVVVALTCILVSILVNLIAYKDVARTTFKKLLRR